ncbi:MAG: 3-phosphoshikimate 1-carboxyvinyltransferase [Thermonema sp.]|uniref:3-phosphoshikimate 1-carboxyvinyltransferase n=1 Tax=Thermonema TaxID=28194 RepID=UPI00056E3142|nr:MULTISPECIES: 3-phosphoshikimate 1-carboxyvinyltransferase [Thermonema]GIV39154.1 MAG: 3-phosphoshikimate 1-carboxyvinyltransferase [Thermonema sp.]
MKSVIVNKPEQKEIRVDIDLPASKSLSNRLLLIEALAQKQKKQSGYTFRNLSTANDTLVMQRLLQEAKEGAILDVEDAGTVMRFMTAYCAVNNLPVILTGTYRMQERPIGDLVDALNQLGAQIEYVKRPGYPPIKIRGFVQRYPKVTIPGGVSSQFLSALLMVAPTLPHGLEINIDGFLRSRSYVEMTVGLMEYFGVKVVWEGNRIKVEAQEYQLRDYTVEPDWSAAGYWYSIAALAPFAHITLNALTENSLQGDKRLVEWMRPMGVYTTFTPQGAVLTKTDEAREVEFDFTDNPDLAQTFIALAAAKGIEMEAYGLESLRLKETDRIRALQNELMTLGYWLDEKHNGEWKLVRVSKRNADKIPAFDTYKDHRMAMAFAPLALKLGKVKINDPEVVKKSYPHFWEDLKKAGFGLEFTNQ